MTKSTNTRSLIHDPATDVADGEGDDSIVLHWVSAVDAAMAEATGIEARALCGDWGEADESMASDITGGRSMVRYESCTECDRIYWGSR